VIFSVILLVIEAFSAKTQGIQGITQQRFKFNGPRRRWPEGKNLT
jgi:hypothetical protein